jgi:hypothetical protein
MGDLGEIRNFGPYMVRILNAIGISTREQLLATDYRTIRDALLAKGVSPHPNIFYSIEMGLQDRVWSSITPEARREIRRILEGG